MHPSIRGPRPLEGAPAHAPLRRWALVAGTVVGAAGVLVIIGWCLDVASLKQVAPGMATLKFNTACCFVLLGVSIVLGAGSRFARVTTVIVAGVAAASIAEYLTGRNFGIDQTFFRDAASGSNYPGRMAGATAVCLLLGTSALFSLRRGHDRSVTRAAVRLRSAE